MPAMSSPELAAVFVKTTDFQSFGLQLEQITRIKTSPLPGTGSGDWTMSTSKEGWTIASNILQYERVSHASKTGRRRPSSTIQSQRKNLRTRAPEFLGKIRVSTDESFTDASLHSAKGDVLAHAYTYTFKPNPGYSSYYVGSVEIHAYLKAVAKKHHIEKYITYNQKLTSAIWDEEKGIWNLSFEVSSPEDPSRNYTFDRTCHIAWKWPAIPGLDIFAGHLCHSAGWEDNYDFTVVKHMKAFVRSPTWIVPSQGFVDPRDEGPKDFQYTEEEKREFRDDPDKFLDYRKQIEWDINRTFPTLLKNNDRQQEAQKIFAKIMRMRLGEDERLATAMIPGLFHVPGTDFTWNLAWYLKKPINFLHAPGS
ncbi:uncharacterized protein PV06_11072 [Exophiala oligosperma]|uniref:Uncharacterized protein n=1 Tax=Exophiala oligosperma TaxID=215243 RepID=A0A0D2A8Y1_9EURO|nr:uncharacterized protein PV06_11072 [Exophiala oligosperma]KIW36786.1 hypothetical protein PV06_11072 [Exophiala oligosperma]